GSPNGCRPRGTRLGKGDFDVTGTATARPSRSQVREARVMTEKEPGRGCPIRPLDWLKHVPFEADAASGRLEWAGLEAVRYRAAPASELNPPAMTHHRFILFARPPEELDLLYDGGAGFRLMDLGRVEAS